VHKRQKKNSKQETSKLTQEKIWHIWQTKNYPRTGTKKLIFFKERPFSDSPAILDTLFVQILPSPCSTYIGIKEVNEILLTAALSLSVDKALLIEKPVRLLETDGSFCSLTLNLQDYPEKSRQVKPGQVVSVELFWLNRIPLTKILRVDKKRTEEYLRIQVTIRTRVSATKPGQKHEGINATKRSKASS